ncbi:UNVERIFIED_CONTAM: hypothetical protein FKN15_047942 [Acipenser sinensis]
MVTPADLSSLSVHSTRTSLSSGLSTSGIPQLTYDGHTATSTLFPVSQLGPKHELDLPHLTSALHPVHPDVKLQKLPFYDMLDELIKPTSLASDNSQRFQETCFAFVDTSQQVQQISSSMDISGTKCDFTVQVQLRLFMEILNSCTDCDEIQFKEDGSWAPMRWKKEVQEVTAYNGVEGACRSTLSEHRQNLHNSMKVEVIDLTLDSSSDEDEDDEPPAKRSCTSLSPASPPISKGTKKTKCIFSTTEHYGTTLLAAAAAAASASEDHDILHPSLNRFLPYSSSQMFLEQPSTPVSSTLAPANGSSSNSSLVSSSSLRDNHLHPVANRNSTEPTTMYGSMPDVISLD